MQLLQLPQARGIQVLQQRPGQLTPIPTQPGLARRSNYHHLPQSLQATQSRTRKATDTITYRDTINVPTLTITISISISKPPSLQTPPLLSHQCGSTPTRLPSHQRGSRDRPLNGSHLWSLVSHQSPPYLHSPQYLTLHVHHLSLHYPPPTPVPVIHPPEQVSSPTTERIHGTNCLKSPSVLTQKR
jgi:hypothetical protein